MSSASQTPLKTDRVVDLYMITPGFFQTMGIAQLSGRDFAHETADAPKVAIVNQTFVKQFFGDRNAIGQRVTGTGATYEIVGVVKNSRSRTLSEELRPILYRSLAQDIGRDPDFRGVSLVVQTQGSPAAMETAVRNQIHALDPAMAIFNPETMEEHLRDALILPRLAGTLFGVFGITGSYLLRLGSTASWPTPSAGAPVRLASAWHSARKSARFNGLSFVNTFFCRLSPSCSVCPALWPWQNLPQVFCTACIPMIR